MQMSLWAMLWRSTRAVAYTVGRGFITLGMTWCLPAVDPAPEGPPPGHPERLCPEVPLSDVELSLLTRLSEHDRTEA